MIRALGAWLRDLFTSSDADDSTAESDHAGSLLDASVNFSHGQEDGRRAVREMEKVNQEASKLQDVDDRRP